MEMKPANDTRSAEVKPVSPDQLEALLLTHSATKSVPIWKIARLSILNAALSYWQSSLELDLAVIYLAEIEAMINETINER